MAKYKLLLPKMGESVAEATIIRWTKNPGDYIEADETVMEIATDKVDSDVPSPVAGKLLEKLYSDNDIVQVGAAIAIIETNEPEVVKETSQPVYNPQPAPVNPAITQEPVIVAGHRVFNETPPPAPKPVEAIPELKAEQAVPAEPKQTIFEEQRPTLREEVPFTAQLTQKVEEKTDDAAKASLRFYSPLVKNIATQEGISNDELDKITGTGAEGRLTKDDLLLYIQNRFKPAAEAIKPAVESTPGSTVSETLAPVVEQSYAEPVATIPPVETVTEKAPVIEEAKQQPVAEAPKPQPVSPTTQPVTPVPQPEPVKQESKSMSGGDEIIEMDRMRRLIADHMVMSMHTSPHVTSFVEADVTNLVLWREKIKGDFEKREGEKITFTPIFIEAVVRAIKDLPMINVQVNGTQIIKKKDINISMATALPSGNLIVPVIKKADELNLIGLTKAVNDLAGRARTGKLKPDDTQGGTFTITNVGTFGNVMGTPIINQPQVAILAVGAIKKKPAVIETLQGDMIGIRHMMFLSLSYDHRVVDGALGGSFVRRVADYLENWETDREF
jgi:2-oxoglutarate dehydrogenase E2 component (dihydrolipoamide succinyltransferase)